MSATRTAATARRANFLIWGAAIATAFSAGALLFSTPRSGQASPPELAFSVLNLPVFPSLVSLALMMLLTSALVRRKRLALVALALMQIGGVAYSALRTTLLLTDPPTDVAPLRLGPVIAADMLSPIAAILVLMVAWRARAEFPGRVTHRSWLLASLVAVIGMVLTVGVTRLLLLLVPSEHDSEAVLLLATLGRAVGVFAPHLGVHVPAHVATLAGLMLGATLLLTAFAVLWSPVTDRSRTGEQEVAVRGLLARCGEQDSLGYFATRRDKSYALAPGGEAAIAYRLQGDVAVAAGDPLGPRAHWDAAMGEFIDLCRRSGWLPAVLSAGEEAARAWTDHGLTAFTMGDEAVLHADRFEAGTAGLTAVRRAAQRARAAGLEVRIRRHRDLSRGEMVALIRYAGQWRTDGPERGFSMALGRLDDPADGNCLLVSAHDADGTWLGLLSFVPWGRTGVSLDLMRRAPEAPHGVNELMVTALMEEGPRLGIRRVSLNFAMFKQVFDEARRLGAGPSVRLASAVLQRGERWFQLESLYRANQKYRPEWVPRYFMADGLLSVGRSAAAAGVLEGFVRLPRRREESGQPLTAEQVAAIEQVDAAAAAAPLADLAPRRSDQSRQRLRHLELLREAGMEPYPVGLPAPQPFAEVAEAIAAQGRGNGAGEDELLVAGRVRRVRELGRVAFVDLVEDGRRIQLVIEEQRTGAAQLRLLTTAVDVGDVLQVRGTAGCSRRGEPSLLVTHWRMASKALQPIPFTSFEDPQARLRSRSTDLIVHPREAGLLRARSEVVQSVRQTLLEAGALEVETPILSSIHGGANARPFRTRINAYSMDLVLRIAPELQLKRLLVGGMGPIFEIGRNFRNEGADATHNPEFTAMETYWPFSDYTGMRLLTERLVKAACRELYGAELMPLRDVRTGADIDGRPLAEQDPDPARRLQALLRDVSGEWPVVPVARAVSQAVGREVDLRTDLDELIELARAHDIELREDMGPGAVLEELYGELVEPRTIRPTFYVDFPEETSPLTAPHRSEPGLVERWDLVACGMEIGTAYSELADPLIQRERLTAQSLKAAAGDPEAMEVDEVFLRALEDGMPPAGGLGIGMDRLAMLLTDTTIREVLTFPFVRPRSGRR